MIRVLVWNEAQHEKHTERVRAVYPEGIHEALAAPLRGEADMQVTTATQDEPEHGLSEAALAATDVVVFWSHVAQADFSDEVVERLYRRVLEGMGLIVLHSACVSKIFRRLMGTTADMKWREADERTRVWVVAPGHPITAGLPECFELAAEEMYGEPCDIPAPDELVFISWFQGGEVCRSGCCYNRGAGRVFYFQPGHETYPSYHDATVQQVLRNAVRWAAPTAGPVVKRGNVPPLEKLGE